VFGLSLLILFFSLKRSAINDILFKGFLIGFYLLLPMLLLGVFNGDLKVVGYWSLFFLLAILIGFLNFYDYKPDIYFAVFSFLLMLTYFSQVGSLSLSEVGVSRLSSDSDENQGFGLYSYCAVYMSAISVYIFAFISRSRLSFFLATVALLLACLIVFYSGARSSFLSMLIVSLLYAYSCCKLFGFFKVFSAVALFLSLSFVILFLGPESDFNSRVSHYFYATLDGVGVIFGDSAAYDESAFHRVDQRQYAIELFMSNFFFGAGYKNYWVDFPLLQAFSDCGIFFGLYYVFFFFLFPALYALSRFGRGSLSGICSFLFLLTLQKYFLHGQPYNWSLFLVVFPILIMYSIEAVAGLSLRKVR
jgi:hypothetical protein